MKMSLHKDLIGHYSNTHLHIIHHIHFFSITHSGYFLLYWIQKFQEYSISVYKIISVILCHVLLFIIFYLNNPTVHVALLMQGATGFMQYSVGWLSACKSLSAARMIVPTVQNASNILFIKQTL